MSATRYQQKYPFLAIDGEIARLIAAFDWGATELGPLEHWPEHIKTATALMLRSKVPLVMLWGATGRMIYNDAYSVVAGGRHPGLLGSKVREGWKEVAEFNDNVMKVGLAGGNLSYKDQELVLCRNGVAEHFWMDLEYSPLPDKEGKPAGVMVVVVDTTEKVRAQRINQGERERLASLFEQAPIVMALLEGPSHRFVMANPNYTHLVGREVIGCAVVDVLPEAAAQPCLKLLDKAYESGEPYTVFASRFERRIGSDPAAVEIFVDFVFQPIRNAASAVSGILVLGVDVTARVTAQRRSQALTELSEQFRALDDWLHVEYAACETLGRSLAVSRVGYGTIDPDAETMYVEADWMASGVDSFAGTISMRRYGSFIDNLKRGELISITDVRADERTASSAAALERRSARSFVNVPVMEQGRLVAVLFVNYVKPRDWTLEEHSFIRDVAERTRIATQRARAEKALRESDARFRTIADAIPQMMWSMLPNGYYDYYSRQWYEFTGTAPISTDGEGWNEMLHPEDRSHASAVWRRSLDTGEPYEIEYRLRHRSGEYRWVLGRALPVRNDAGAIVRWVGTWTPIHEHKLAQEELVANNRRKDEFLAMLAHELRNPLAPINTAAQLLKAAPMNGAIVERSADIISRQVRHMTELVDDLLDVSRVTRGLVELERSRVELKAVLANAVEQVRPLIEVRGHQLTTHMPPGDVYVLGDRTRLVQVMSNLLNNAAKYTPTNGSLTLSLSVSQHVQVRVADNGIGIDAKLLPHVFDLFTQAERTPDRSQGGLGLGLALVRSLVDLHGGHITVESAGLGRGSTFTVTLPGILMAEPAASAASEAGNRIDLPRASHPMRVMVVDDNEDAAETLGALLESLGHKVRVAHDSAQALESVRDDPRDVFILDIGLPGMDGYQLARLLRAHPNGSEATYIALTGYGGSLDKQLGEEAGFQHYLVKPAELDELARLVQPKWPGAVSPGSPGALPGATRCDEN